MAIASKLNRTVFRVNTAKLALNISPAQNVRLSGVLLAGVNLLDDTITFERVDVTDWQTLTVIVDITAGGLGVLDIDLYPLGSGATSDDTTGVRLTAAAPTTVSAAVLANASQEIITMDVSEYKYVDIELDVSAGGTDNADITWVDVFFG